MNEEEYWKIYYGLEDKKTIHEKEKLLKRYKIKEGILYKKKRNEKLVKIIRRYEIEAVMYMMHDHPTSGHFAIKATYNKVKERYYWPNMRNDVEIYVKTCDQYQRRGKPQGENELHSIKLKNYFIKWE
jgi:hypothetical protein